MSQDAAKRWNIRHSLALQNGENLPRQILTQNASLLNPPGLALDAAMGTGANAAYLVSLGWRVIGIDISFVAALHAHTRRPQIMACVADLDEFTKPLATFDLILNFYYLQRSLWPLYYEMLKPGGLLILETLTTDMLTKKPGLTPEFLLKPGELIQSFANWEKIMYDEGWMVTDHGSEKAVSRMIARRPLQ